MKISVPGLFVGFQLVASPLAARAQAPIPPLTNVRAAIVVVDTFARTLPAPLSLQRLQTIAELRLRAGGLTVYAMSDHVPPSADPVLILFTIDVLPTKAQDGTTTGYAFATQAEAIESVTLPRNGATTSALLWLDTELHIAPPATAAADLERSVTEVADKLANAWLAANPRR